MYKATKEVDFNGRSYKIGETIENPTQRMIELGIVEFKNSAEVKPVKSTEVNELPEVTEPLIEVEVIDTKEVLLIDDSSSVNVSTEELKPKQELKPKKVKRNH